MKTSKILAGIIATFSMSASLNAQQANLVMNNSFENSDGKAAKGSFIKLDSISSSNNTTVDLYSAESNSRDYKAPSNWMGTQSAKTGNNYAGIIAYYADDAGIFKTKPGYRKYSEYIQVTFSEPLVAGKAYNISYNVSLAEKSAYAVSGLGAYFSEAKIDVQNNAFLKVTPHIVWTDIQSGNDWTTLSSTYVAGGGERHLTIGCFNKYMEVSKVIPEKTNNSRKAYYYIDDVSLTPSTLEPEHLTSLLYNSCYQLSNLNFETDKAVILASSYDELNSLSHFLKTYPYVLVYVDGYTDKTGTEQHNDKLSEERAKSVKEYLAKDGIDVNRLRARGFGETQPIDKVNENSFVNRRVEITICATGK